MMLSENGVSTTVSHRQDWTKEGLMEWWTFLATSIALLLIVFIDGNAMLELRLFFRDLAKAASHLYLALLPLCRAATHFTSGIRHLLRHGLQSQSHYSDSTDYKSYLVSHAQQRSFQGYRQGQSLAKEGMLHLLQGVCVVCEAVLNLMGAVLSVATAFCHILQGGFYILAVMLRSIQIKLLSQMNGER